MRKYQSLTLTKWDYKYLIVFILKKRKKTISEAARKHLGELLHELAMQRECRIVVGYLMPDHVYRCISPAQVLSVVYGELHQGQECVFDSSAFYGKCEELHRREFLGAEIFLFNHEAGGGGVRAYIRD